MLSSRRSGIKSKRKLTAPPAASKSQTVMTAALTYQRRWHHSMIRRRRPDACDLGRGAGSSVSGPSRPLWCLLSPLVQLVYEKDILKGAAKKEVSAKNVFICGRVCAPTRTLE